MPFFSGNVVRGTLWIFRPRALGSVPSAGHRLSVLVPVASVVVRRQPPLRWGVAPPQSPHRHALRAVCGLTPPTRVKSVFFSIAAPQSPIKYLHSAGCMGVVSITSCFMVWLAFAAPPHTVHCSTESRGRSSSSARDTGSTVRIPSGSEDSPQRKRGCGTTQKHRERAPLNRGDTAPIGPSRRAGFGETKAHQWLSVTSGLFPAVTGWTATRRNVTFRLSPSAPIAFLAGRIVAIDQNQQKFWEINRSHITPRHPFQNKGVPGSRPQKERKGKNIYLPIGR